MRSAARCGAATAVLLVLAGCSYDVDAVVLTGTYVGTWCQSPCGGGGLSIKGDLAITLSRQGNDLLADGVSHYQVFLWLKSDVRSTGRVDGKTLRLHSLQPQLDSTAESSTYTFDGAKACWQDGTYQVKSGEGQSKGTWNACRK